MKNRITVAIAVVLTVGSLASCVKMMQEVGNAQESNMVSAAVKVELSGGSLDNSYVNGLVVRFINTDENITIEAPANAAGIARADIIPGNYNVSVVGSVVVEETKWLLNGAKNGLGFIEDVADAELSSSDDLVLDIFPVPEGSLVIKEIFYAGSPATTETPGTYFRNQFYEIFNNGTETKYLDMICFAQLTPTLATATPPQWPAEDGVNKFVYGDAVWQFPGDGDDYPLAPGESVILAQYGIDHTKERPNALVDNSKVEWETYTGYPSRNNPDVPDFKYVYFQYFNSMQWLTTVGGGAFVLYDPGMELTYNDTEYWVKGVTTQSAVGNSTLYAKIPAEQIIDGVECVGSEGDLNKKRVPGFIDAGAAWVGASYNNMSVTRKIIGEREDGTPILQDTNDSTSDFEAVTPPEHRRGGAKQPSWSWSYGL
jgi:hypothetical protein